MKQCVAGCMVFADGIRHHKDCPLSSHAVLDEVRALKRIRYDDEKGAYGIAEYYRAIDDVIEILSEHFI